MSKAVVMLTMFCLTACATAPEMTRTVVWKSINPNGSNQEREVRLKVALATCRNYASQTSALTPMPPPPPPQVNVQQSIQVGEGQDYSFLAHPAALDANREIMATQAQYAMQASLAAGENAMNACMAQNGFILE